jgi:exosortase A-associated hydrolase 2
VLWQPVASGEALLTQTLRIRLAAALGGGGSGETTGSLRQKLKAGETLEIAGYPIAPALAASLDALRMTEPPKGAHTAWFEVGSEPRAEVGPGAMRAIERWRQSGHSVTQATVAAPPFWSLMETETAPALIEATLGFLGLKVGLKVPA